MNQITNKIAAMTITQVTEAQNSNNMEKIGFIKGLEFSRTNGMTVDQITTDRHSQIRKLMMENEKDNYTSVRYLAFLQKYQEKFSGCCKKEAISSLEWMD